MGYLFGGIATALGLIVLAGVLYFLVNFFKRKPAKSPATESTGVSDEKEKMPVPQAAAEPKATPPTEKEPAAKVTKESEPTPKKSWLRWLKVLWWLIFVIIFLLTPALLPASWNVSSWERLVPAIVDWFESGAAWFMQEIGLTTLAVVIFLLGVITFCLKGGAGKGITMALVAVVIYFGQEYIRDYAAQASFDEEILLRPGQYSVQKEFGKNPRVVYTPPGHCVQWRNAIAKKIEVTHQVLQAIEPAMVTLTVHHGDSAHCRNANK